LPGKLGQDHTTMVTNLEPLDLVLLNDNTNAWGAHVGVYIGKNQILHLSKANGLPAIKELQYLLQNPKYNYFIGAKRCRSMPPLV